VIDVLAISSKSDFMSVTVHCFRVVYNCGELYLLDIVAVDYQCLISGLQECGGNAAADG
jgi:hypothetical protein